MGPLWGPPKKGVPGGAPWPAPLPGGLFGQGPFAAAIRPKGRVAVAGLGS